ncbi:MAG: MotA/TolQ/ExbB proton channel family protein [Gammaproteobacteria bacterium]|nr:MotA/TolQ/ExbB proton channel family protein [Gammaproteobacteria bacterium]MDH5692334.1 MotA/TolQ/ExbB proton channel family protein [Gammaproteobacteria bacterium]
MIDSFFDLMSRGGPVMWVIFITAWVALILLVERTLRIQSWLKLALKDQDGFLHDPKYVPNHQDVRGGSPVSMVLDKISWDEVKTSEDFGKQLNIHLADMMPKLEGMLPTVSIIGSLLPMLGLLGTVTGMIEVFQVIAIHGTGNPEEMAHGISQALLTTASGLIIAIPVIFSHHLLTRRLRLLLSVTEQSMHVVYKRGLGLRP